MSTKRRRDTVGAMDATTDVEPMDLYEVKEKGGQSLSFHGELIGSATSQSERRPRARWSELRIYRTQSGRYVVEGVGRSTIAGEVDRPWAHVVDTPAGVVNSCHLTDADDIRYIPEMNRRALEEACEHDDDLRAAYAVQVID
jgi:hypothetical protein